MSAPPQQVEANSSSFGTSIKVTRDPLLVSYCCFYISVFVCFFFFPWRAETVGHGLKSRHVLYYLVAMQNSNKVPTASTMFLVPAVLRLWISMYPIYLKSILQISNINFSLPSPDPTRSDGWWGCRHHGEHQRWRDCRTLPGHSQRNIWKQRCSSGTQPSHFTDISNTLTFHLTLACPSLVVDL